MRIETETLQKPAEEYLKRFGIKFEHKENNVSYKKRKGSRQNFKGKLDLYIWLPNAIFIAVEFKIGNNDLTLEQKDEVEEFKTLGYPVYIIRDDIKMFYYIIDSYLIAIKETFKKVEIDFNQDFK